jgi:hypothetical protein
MDKTLTHGDFGQGPKVAGVYNGKTVYHKPIEGNAVGNGELAKPNQFNVDPAKVAEIAKNTGARESAIHTLVCHHEHTHIEHKLGYARLVDADNNVVIPKVPGETWSPDLIRAQSVANRMQTEMAVVQRMRMDFNAGKIPGVTRQEWNIYEKWHQNLFNSMKNERDMYLLKAGVMPKRLR